MRCKLFSVILSMALIMLPHAALAVPSVKTTGVGHGVEVWYVKNDTVPVVDIQISFEGAGAASDPLGKEGRAAFAASMLNESSGPYSSVEFQRAFDERAIQFEADASADRMVVHVHCLREHASRVGELLALALTQPQFEANDMARVKSQFYSQFKRFEESPGYQAGRRFNATAFAGHPYARPTYGTPASVASLTDEDLRGYMNTYVTRGNLVVTAAGDVDAGLLDDLLEPLVDALPANDSGAIQVARATMQGANRTVLQPISVPQSVVVMGAPGIPRHDARFYAAYMLNHILGGDAMVSRLSKRLRKDKGFVYGSGSNLEELRGASLIKITLATRTSQAREAVKEAQAVLSELREQGVSASECEDARTYLLGSFPLQLDSSSDLASMLMTMRMYGLGEDYLEERDQHFREVECREVNALARELLNPARFLAVIAGAESEAP